MTNSQTANDLCQKKLAIIEEIGNAILATDDVSTISYLILDLAINHTRAEKGSLMLVGGQKELYILSARGLEHKLAKSYRIKIGEGIAGTVAARGEAVLVKDIDSDPRFQNSQRDRYKTRSFISCPIIGKEELLGVLNINDKKNGQPFSEDEFSLLKVIAGQAALALKNSFLVRRFREKSAEMEELNRKLISMDLSKTDFLTRVSHELRTPLNSVKGAVYYLKKSDLAGSDVLREFHDIIESETDKLISIVDRQLDFLRLGEENRVLRKTLFSLAELLREILRSHLLKQLLERKKIALNLAPPEELPEVAGDRILVSQMFLNLFEGISYHLKRQGEISLHIVQNDLLDVVLQTGEALPERVVDDFFSSKNLFSQDKAEPSLKLYLARKAAEVNGWRVFAENRKEGFRVTVLIPKGERQKIEAALAMTMDRVIEFTSELLGVNTCSLMLSDHVTGDLVINSARGLEDEIIRNTRIKLGDRIAGWVAYEGKPLLIEDIEADPRFGQKNFDRQYNSKSLISLPLKCGGQVIGVLNLNNKKTDQPFTERDLKIATIIGERISRFIEKIQAEAGQGGDLRRTVGSLDALLNAESRYPKKDTRHADLMGKVLDQLGANEKDKELALYVAMVYDLGLMLLDKNLLEKKKKLTAAEASTLKSHPYTTLELLEGLEFSEEVRQVILHHHERYDGQGYPDGLVGERIPFLARVLAVVDAFCAMTEDRPYRKAKTVPEALREIQEGAGSLYDPRVVEALRGAVIGGDS
ncbi:histidine kinase [Desulfuromonas versatilis]|uniref:histidine kinase n=1 Tax=Desulfuromonas versatilis TaxID=2802975 RepID=A0ABN6DYY7_9BACT|nr:GAF domain-containing protein [Desulfuromonas versatilis]BCR05300.1 histidine kinase [Desulfuromonas versatilis]